jgi:hypothetical protein
LRLRLGLTRYGRGLRLGTRLLHMGCGLAGDDLCRSADAKLAHVDLRDLTLPCPARTREEAATGTGSASGSTTGYVLLVLGLRLGLNLGRCRSLRGLCACGGLRRCHGLGGFVGGGLLAVLGSAGVGALERHV